VLVVTVRCTLTTEVVTLHSTGKTLTLAHCSGVNHFALFKGVNKNLLTHFVTSYVVKAKLNELLTWSNTSFFEVTLLRLRNC